MTGFALTHPSTEADARARETDHAEQPRWEPWSCPRGCRDWRWSDSRTPSVCSAHHEPCVPPGSEDPSEDLPAAPGWAP